MNIKNLVKKAELTVLGLAIAAGCAGATHGCGDTYTNFNNNGSAGSASEYQGEASRVICERFISCCHQVPDQTTQAVCLLRAGGNINATVSDCMEHFEATFPEEVLECIADTFECRPDPLGYNWQGQCGGKIAALKASVTL